MGAGAASGGRWLPRGCAVFTTFPDLLFIFESAHSGMAAWRVGCKRKCANPTVGKWDPSFFSPDWQGWGHPGAEWKGLASTGLFLLQMAHLGASIHHLASALPRQDSEPMTWDDPSAPTSAPLPDGPLRLLPAAATWHISPGHLQAVWADGSTPAHLLGANPQLFITSSVPRTFPLRKIFGGLVWILITWSQVPNPQVQGWVMFVSVFCFIATTLLLFLYVAGAHKTGTFWINLDAAYHCIAFLFYLSASIFEAFLTIWPDERNEDKQHIQNISAGSLFIVTLLYLIHAVFSLIRWKSF